MARSIFMVRDSCLLLKNHHAPTVMMAATLSELHPKLAVRGGIALNRSVGGLNPAAVEAALMMGAAMVWLPTQDAEHERQSLGKPGTGIRIVDATRVAERNGKVAFSVTRQRAPKRAEVTMAAAE